MRWRRGGTTSSSSCGRTRTRRRAIRSRSTACHRSSGCTIETRAGQRSRRRAADRLPGVRASAARSARGASGRRLHARPRRRLAAPRLPRALRPPLVYESHGYAPGRRGGAAASCLPTRRSVPRREAAAARAARGARLAGARTGMSRSPQALARRPARPVRCAAAARRHARRIERDSRCRPRTRSADRRGRPSQLRPQVVRRSSPMRATCIRGKASTCCSRRSRAVPNARGLIVGGHAKEPDLAA